MDLSQNRTQDFETAEDGGRDEPASTNAKVERAIPSFVKAMICVAIGGEYCNLVTKVLETDCSVDDEAFCATNTEVGVKKDNVLCFIRCRDWVLLLLHLSFHWIFWVMIILIGF